MLFWLRVLVHHGVEGRMAEQLPLWWQLQHMTHVLAELLMNLRLWLGPEVNQTLLTQPLLPARPGPSKNSNIFNYSHRLKTNLEYKPMGNVPDLNHDNKINK